MSKNKDHRRLIKVYDFHNFLNLTNFMLNSRLSLNSSFSSSLGEHVSGEKDDGANFEAVLIWLKIIMCKLFETTQYINWPNLFFTSQQE